MKIGFTVCGYDVFVEVVTEFTSRITVLNSGQQLIFGEPKWKNPIKKKTVVKSFPF